MKYVPLAAMAGAISCLISGSALAQEPVMKPDFKVVEPAIKACVAALSGLADEAGTLAVQAVCDDKQIRGRYNAAGNIPLDGPQVGTCPEFFRAAKTYAKVKGLYFGKGDKTGDMMMNANQKQVTARYEQCVKSMVVGEPPKILNTVKLWD